MAGALPRYGTCRMSTPAIILNISPDRWIVPPLPDDANVSLPGCALASAITSLTRLRLHRGMHTITFIDDAIGATATKSAAGSSGMLLKRLGLIAMLPAAPKCSV